MTGKKQIVERIFVVVALSVAGVSSWLADSSGAAMCAFAAALVGMVMMRVATRGILAISYKQKIFDQPDQRRIHKTPTPRLGGLAFAPAITCSTILGIVLYTYLSPGQAPLSGYAMPLAKYIILIVPMILLWMVGVTDDIVGVRWSMKFAIQTLAAMMVIYAGLRIDNLHGLLGIHRLPFGASVALTALFIVAVINALNLIDGIDGLASGLCIVTAALYGARMLAAGEYLFSFMAFATMGVLIPFFYTNVWGYSLRRRKLFMGDTGSLTVGLVMGIFATVLMTGEGKADPDVRDFTLAFSPLLVPLFDVVHVSLFRVVRGVSPFLPDKTHIHHRMLAKGFSRRATVALVIALAVAFAAINRLLAPHLNLTLVLAVDAVVWMVFNSRVLKARGFMKTVL